ncbi:MAG: GNAT family N-acetyltransferase [Pirellulales bacterium]|nr:GNAT family N-acetyltransferase [Pirellulales bacterium]
MTCQAPALELRPLRPDEWPAVAELIRESTNAWYVAHGKPPIFTGPPEATLLFPQVYEDLDPGCCLVAADAATEQLLGSCFYHPRPTHVSLGIMNVASHAFGRGVAGKLLAWIVNFARERQQSVRLVSSAQNLDSFSLYTRQGFSPRAIFQDLLIHVPHSGLPESPPPTGWQLRPAEKADLAAMTALEEQLVGISRPGDYIYFHDNHLGCWQTSVAIDAAGELAGFLVTIQHPGSTLAGPGVMRDEETALALLPYALNRRRDWSPVVLVPADRPRLVRGMYDWGAKNVELHVLQVHGAAQELKGVVIPTFMPESG